MVGAEQPKTPRRDCKKAATWERYYENMAAWFEDAADTVNFTFRYSESVRVARSDATRFREGAAQIAQGKHPNIVAGRWS